ncbi:MAG TPA: hypothetical protein VEX60_10665 [Pyrinomonadaceae bacterium]|nr:hypothetical protein [Pyrinomonadaceae bacterium]
MKNQLLHSALALTFALCGAAAFGQSVPGPKKARTPDDYQPRTLKEIAAPEDAAEVSHDGEKEVALRGDVSPSRVRVVYAGSTRPLPSGKKSVIKEWARRFAGSPEHYTEPYEDEALFTEDGAEHWLAVHKKLVPRLKEELKKGEALELFVIRLGGVRTGSEWEGVILVESLRKPE